MVTMHGRLGAIVSAGLLALAPNAAAQAGADQAMNMAEH